jgi:hypothetical protein
MSEFERIISDSMGPFSNMYGEEISAQDIVDDLNITKEEYNDLPDYIPGYDDGEWDPIMGDAEDWIETDDEWLDDFQGEEEFA